jgi:hypothetical protein
MFAVVWHYWIGVSVFLLGMFVVVGLIGQYLSKTQAPKYPRNKE